jgi:hypothetical protein
MEWNRVHYYKTTKWPIVPAPDDECEQSVECLAGETEVLGENLPQYRFVHHKSHMIRSAHGTPRWEAGD